MDWVRFFTGFFLALIGLFFIYFGDFLYIFFIILIAITAFFEFYKLVINNKYNFEKLLLSSFGVMYIIALILTTYCYGIKYISIVSILNTIIVIFLSVNLFKYNSNIPIIILKYFGCLFYISVPLALLTSIRFEVFGLEWTLIIFGIVAAGDIGAYYFGYFFGQHKLCSYISPKKTIEGFFGGVFSSILIAIFFKFYFNFNISLYFIIFFASSVGIVGHVGDLFISQFKRLADVKDSGSILPGHGGVLDRIDGLLLATLWAYMLIFFILPYARIT